MPESARGFQLRLPGFDGSIDELLRLAAERRVDLDSVRAMDITAQIAQYVCESDRLDLAYAGDAISVAARIMALKSGRLLLQAIPDEVMVSTGVERTPLLDAGSLVHGTHSLRALEGLESFPLPGMSDNLPPRMEPRDSGLLARAWTGMRQRSQEAVGLVSLPSFMRLETAISGLIRTLRTRSRLSFRRLTRESSRNDAVVHFLAVLELCRRREAHAEQHDLFGDITIEHREQQADADTAVRAG